MDLPESSTDHSESSMVPNAISMDRRESYSETRAGHSSQDHSQSSMDRRGGSTGMKFEESSEDSSHQHSKGTEEEQVDHSDDTSGFMQWNAIPHVTQAETRDDSSAIEIENMEELNNVIELGNLSQVSDIHLNGQDSGSGHFILAKALASGQMTALKYLRLDGTGLVEDHSEAIGNALSSQRFPSLISILFKKNKIGTKGVEALGRAIRSGNLEQLLYLHFREAHINDDDMATLANAFIHGEVSVLPNLSALYLRSNHFTEVGLRSLATALKSGRLNSLDLLDVQWSSNPSEEGANALVSALALNNRLTMDVLFEWHKFPDLHRHQKQLRRRNIRQKSIVAKLLDSPMVPAAFGKVYICGNPKVGKTTLTHTLQRTLFQSICTWERRPHVEKRTSGIAVSRFSSKDTQQTEIEITLMVWDMAGQQDYHLVHNAFFPDLSFSEGKATSFVIVCTSENLDKSKQQLQYWLRYIASSSDKTGHQFRPVFVVLNNLGGHQRITGPNWEQVLQSERDKFKGCLNIQTHLFLVDVRRRHQVQHLKNCLLDHARSLLTKERVPKLCQVIQQHLTIWIQKRKQFPVVHWKEFVHDVQRLIAPWVEGIIEAATRYLNEAGVLIHIDKAFPPEWGTTNQRLVVLDPNWICREVVGKIFLSEDMVNQKEGKHLFRNEVNRTTGSISISDFKEFFKSFISKWSDSQIDDLITILLWLGLCYKGRDRNVFIPALIDKNGRLEDLWQPESTEQHGEDQWVMGFSIEHKKSEKTLAPMSLWHRFQVELAQTPKFNGGVVDNDFVAGKNFMTFTVEYMNVQITVDANEDIPTFDKISIFVKPMSIDKWDGDRRKQRQVDQANDLLEILLGLWNTVCPTVEYLCRVVWPWPASQSRPRDKQSRNVDVRQVKKWVEEHGLGRTMHWTVGSNSAITEDQLLSTNDKQNVIKSVQSDVSILRERMREAVDLRIYPPELTQEVPFEEGRVGSDGTERVTLPTGPTGNWHKIDEKLDRIINNQDKILKKMENVENMLREGFAKVLNEQKRVLRKVQDTARFFKEDKDRTCPNLIYLGQKDSGVWTTLKDALSLSVNVRLRFACEAMFNNYRPHEVKDQEGVDVSRLKPSLQKIAPWLKVSLTVLLISAKIGANFVAPGLGLIVPDFQQWQQVSSLSEGIEWATGLAKEELDKVMIEGMGLDSNDALWNPRNVYGKSRAAITNLVGKLTPDKYEQKFGLRKVCLRYSDESLHGVVWICTECHKYFTESNLISDM